LRGLLQQGNRPAPGVRWRRRARQGRDLRLDIGVVLPRFARACDIVQRVFRAALQVCGSRPPDDRPSDAEDRHDLGLRNAAIKRGKNMRPIEQMQEDLDRYLHHYNHERPHQGRMMEGRPPIQMFLEGIVEQPELDLAEAA